MHLGKTTINMTLLATVFIGGCWSPVLVPSKYSPKYSGNVPRINASVIIREVKDLRQMRNDEYFHDIEDYLNGRFDRPIQAVVKEALTYELERAGLKVVEPSASYDNNTLVLECNIETFEVKCAEGPNKEFVMNASVVLVFNWLDIQTDALMSVRRREETSTIPRSRNQYILESKTEVNPYSSEDKADLRLQASCLIDELLPKVIQAELRGSDYLKKVVEKK